MWSWSKKPTTRTGLQTLDQERLSKDRLRLAQAEQRLAREIEELEQRKSLLFQQGVECLSDRQRTQFARKIKELDTTICAKDQQLGIVDRNLQALTSLALLADNQRTATGLGLESIIEQVDLKSVRDFVDLLRAEQDLAQGRIQTLSTALGQQQVMCSRVSDDAEVGAIVQAMQIAAGRTSAKGEQSRTERANSQPKFNREPPA